MFAVCFMCFIRCAVSKVLKATEYVEFVRLRAEPSSLPRTKSQRLDSGLVEAAHPLPIDKSMCVCVCVRCVIVK